MIIHLVFTIDGMNKQLEVVRAKVAFYYVYVRYYCAVL